MSCWRKLDGRSEKSRFLAPNACHGGLSGARNDRRMNTTQQMDKYLGLDQSARQQRFVELLAKVSQ